MQRLAFQGQHRLYLLRLPPGKPADASGWPLVVVFHGGGGDALNVERMTRFTELGRQQGFAVLYPQGTSAAGQRLGTWNAQHCCGTAMRQRVNDTGFVEALLDDMLRRHPIDPKRLYATGLSNGGMMGYRLACEASDVFRAVAAVAECQQAGVRVLMITGDHATTAAAIGASLGLRDGNPITGAEIDTLDDAALGARLAQTDVIARASPEHKLRLVANLQAGGQLVAMTGDGVNDAPALKAADIGVAMGQRGTDAAREAADLVLTDDNFATIAHAVREGRRVFDNIKKSLLFILPTNGGEAGLILIAVFAGLAMPVTAAQILWINMVTSITLDISLAFEPAERGVMRRPPRPANEPLITRWMLTRVVFVSLLLMGASFLVFNWQLARGGSLEMARTTVINLMVVGEIFYLFNVRHFTASGLTWETLLGNPVAVWTGVITLVLQLLLTYAPPMQQLFGTAALDAPTWGVIVALAAGLFVAVEAEKAWLRYRGVHRI